MKTYTAYDQRQIKHLELIQAVIARLGNNGFLVKGWAVTVSGVFFGFAVSSKDAQLALASVLPTSIFWLLDAYFLRCERLFRELYERVRVGDETIAPFFMGATADTFVTTAPKSTAFAYAAFSPTLRGLYGLLLGSAVVVFILLSAAPASVAP